MAAHMQRLLCVCPRLTWVNVGKNKSIKCTSSFLYQSRLISRSSITQQVPGFEDEQVQSILKRITGKQLEKIFKPTKEKLVPPKYRLLSEAKLKEVHDEVKVMTEERLEMPPVLVKRTDINEVLAENPELRGLETSKYIFTDITVGISDQDRFIVVREPDGTLRKASWEERDRLIQVYMPRPGRLLKAPPLFEDPNMQHFFNDERHEELLNMTCVQFEPDNKYFIQIHTSVYEDLENTWKYDLLRSTRHFGGMVFHLTLSKRIDGLLTDMITRELLHDAFDLVKLFHLLHPDCSSMREVKEKNLTGTDIIKAYIAQDANHPGRVELALQAYQNERLHQQPNQELTN